MNQFCMHAVASLGGPCKWPTMLGSPYCGWHQPRARASDPAEAARRLRHVRGRLIPVAS